MADDRTKYVVFKANIMDDEGQKRKDGDVVSLTPKTARHYNKLGFLRPYMGSDDEDDYDDDDEAELEEETPQLARSRRAPAVTENTRLSPGTTAKPVGQS